MDRLDVDGDGQVSYGEFLRFFGKSSADARSETELKQQLQSLLALASRKGVQIADSFRHFDARNDGRVSRDQFQAALCELTPKIRALASDEKQLIALFQAFDADSDGMISRKEFEAFAKSAAARPVARKPLTAARKRLFSMFERDFRSHAASEEKATGSLEETFAKLLGSDAKAKLRPLKLEDVLTPRSTNWFYDMLKTRGHPDWCAEEIMGKMDKAGEGSVTFEEFAVYLRSIDPREPADGIDPESPFGLALAKHKLPRSAARLERAKRKHREALKNAMPGKRWYDVAMGPNEYNLTALKPPSPWVRHLDGRQLTRLTSKATATDAEASRVFTAWASSTSGSRGGVLEPKAQKENKAENERDLFSESVLRETARILRIHRERLSVKEKRKAFIATRAASDAVEKEKQEGDKGGEDEAAEVLQKAFRRHSKLNFRRASQVAEATLDR